MDTDEIKEIERLAILFPRFDTAVWYLTMRTGFSYKTCIVWMRFLRAQQEIERLRLTQ